MGGGGGGLDERKRDGKGRESGREGKDHKNEMWGGGGGEMEREEGRKNKRDQERARESKRG